jgi:hypothetical protein
MHDMGDPVKHAMHDMDAQVKPKAAMATAMCDTFVMLAVVKDCTPKRQNIEDTTNHSIRVNAAYQPAWLRAIKGNLPRQIFHARQILSKPASQYLPCIDHSITINAAPSHAYYSSRLHDIKGNSTTHARQALPKSASQYLPCSSSTQMMISRSPCIKGSQNT